MLSIPTPNVGRWWLLGARCWTDNGQSVGDDVIQYRPFFVTRACQLDALAIRLDGSGAGVDNTQRLGIYASGDDGLPAALMAQTADIETLGDGNNTVKNIALAMTADLVPGRLYYVAIIQRQSSGGAQKFDATDAGTAGRILTLGGVSAAEALDGTADFAAVNHAAASWTVMPDPAVMTSPSYSVINPIGIAGQIATGFAGEGPGHAPFVYPWGNTGLNRRWYIASAINKDNGTGVLGSGAIDFVPFFVSEDCQIDTMAFQVTTGAGGSLVRVGIFASAASGVPGALLVQSAEVSTATTGVKELAVALDLTAKTNYWAVVGARSGAPTIRKIAFPHDKPGSTHLGNPTADIAVSNAKRQTHMTGAGFDGSGFPTPASPSYSNADFAQIAFRILTA